MQKKIATLLLLSSLVCPVLLLATQETVSKGHSSTHVLREHGKLYFHFTVHTLPDDVLQTLIGQWQAAVVTPDNRVFYGPKIDAAHPPSQFVILVDAPIVFGNYLMHVENINAKYIGGVQFIGGFIEPDITVSNSFNSKVATCRIPGIAVQAIIPASVPSRRAVQGYFVPPFNFIE